MPHKKKIKSIRNDFDKFALTVKRLFPNSKISAKLLKTIWRNKQLRALFINLMFVRAFAPIVEKVGGKKKKSKKKAGKTKTRKDGKTKKKRVSRLMTRKQKIGLMNAIRANPKMTQESKDKALQTLRKKKTRLDKGDE